MLSGNSKLMNLVNKIDWMQIQSTRGGNTGKPRNPDEMRIALQGKNGSDPNVTMLKIELGTGIMAKLGWVYGDRVDLFAHPDDQLAFRAVRSPNSGYKISKFKDSIVGRIQLAWPHKHLKMKPLKSTSVEYLIHEGMLYFRVEA